MRISGVVVLSALLHAGMAEARFGKGGSGGTTSGGGSQPTHAAVPVDSKESSSSSSSSSPSVPSSSGGSTSTSSVAFDANRGYYTGAFVPLAGYAYPTLLEPEDEQGPRAQVRATAGLEALYFTNQNRGYALGLNAGLEIDRIFASISAQHLSVATDDGSAGDDHLEQLSVRLGYALYVGKQGRLRAELGADTIFAADVVVLGPTFGFSGSLWIWGPIAFEGSLHGSVYPFWQLDGRAGLVVGLGALGLRVGFRTQLLDDQGIVDGVAHRDVFIGPYAGLGFAL